MKKQFEGSFSETTISTEDLKQIHRYSKKKLNKDEVYVFSVVLCDNEIDRDYEQFSVQTLKDLSTLFLGKSGVLDHDAVSKNQHARIFDTCLEEVEGKKNASGETYYRLVGRAYIPRIQKYQELIEEIETGIKKEVSVSCSVSKATCSICHTERSEKTCAHKAGKTYNNKLCYTVLDGAKDAYEWSFVAVPAQRAAGVLKKFSFDETLPVEQMVEKMAGIETDIYLSKDKVKALTEYIALLEKEANFGMVYREKMIVETVQYAKSAVPKLDRENLIALTEQMDVDELQHFHHAFEAQAKEKMPNMSQLMTSNKEKEKKNDNDIYCI